MPTQLTFDFSHPAQPAGPVIRREEWLDVTDIARGLGFTSPVEVSTRLNDALESRQGEPEDAHDQRLFDFLWLAHVQWTLSEGEAATLNFFFERANSTAETRLRMRLELLEGIIRLDLLNQAICPLFD
jgi:hypothetical protein